MTLVRLLSGYTQGSSDLQPGSVCQGRREGDHWIVEVDAKNGRFERFALGDVVALDDNACAEYCASDYYVALMPVYTDSRNGEHYVIDSDGVIIAGPMRRSCAARVMFNVNRFGASA